MLYYTYQEVLLHNNENSCWILVDRNIYDVTEFLDIHPGSKKAILKYACQNVKQSYKYHSKGGRDLWKNYLIGKLLKKEIGYILNVF